MAWNRKRAEHDMSMQRWLAFYVCFLLGVSCLAALSMFYLDGFSHSGFSLPAGLMHWIGGITVGSLAGLAVIVYRFFFRNR